MRSDVHIAGGRTTTIKAGAADEDEGACAAGGAEESVAGEVA